MAQHGRATSVTRTRRAVDAVGAGLYITAIPNAFRVPAP